MIPLSRMILVGVGVLAGLRAEAASPQVYAGSCSDSSYLVDGSGTLSAWGSNLGGNLGVGGYNNQLIPVAISFPTGVHGWRALSVAEGFSAEWTLAIGDDSQLYAAGYIWSSFPQYLTLVQPPAGVSGWTKVSASDQGWLVVSTSGAIYGDVNGRVWWPQPPAGAQRWTQVGVCSYFSPDRLDLFAMDDAGRLYGVYSGRAWFSDPGFTQIPVPAGATAWTNLVTGGLFALAQANDGNLYGWGANSAGSLGLGYGFTYTNVPQKVVLPAGKTAWNLVSAGSGHVLATTTDGQLYAWGYNGYGQLGLGSASGNRYSPTPVPDLTNVTAVAAGNYHSLVVADCRVLAWGMNSCGQLGAGFSSAFYPLPLEAQLTYDICSTNPPPLPLVSITASDPNASEGTWLSTLGKPVTNTGRFEISRTVATGVSLQVGLSVVGTAVNGVDYFTIPSSVTIPANSNSVSVLVVPTGDALASDPSTVVMNLLSDPAYQLGNSTNAIVTLIQYDSPGTPPLPTLTFQLFVGTNQNGTVFAIQSSTNLTDWSVVANATNVWGIVSFTETNRFWYRQRFFRAIPSSGN